MTAPKFIRRIAKSLYAVIGVVLIWRGVWVLLDRFDHHVFGYDSEITAVLGLILGFILLFVHDHKVDELGHL